MTPFITFSHAITTNRDDDDNYCLRLLPLILFRDPRFCGMANAMAFGLAVGTILTLGVVPVLYALFYRVIKNGGDRVD